MIDLQTILTGTDPEPAYLIQHVLYQSQMIVVAGEPGVGKSFLQYNLAMCIAANIKFLDLPTVHGPVLYFDEENGRADLQQYLRWAWRGLGKPSIELLQQNLHIEHFNLAKAGFKRFAYMVALAKQVQPVLIVVDTATPVCSIQDENDNAEASRAVRALRQVKEAAGPACTMIILKHSRFSHDPKERQTIRGAKAWLGEVDGTLYHKLAVGKPRQDGLHNSRLIPDKVRAFGLRKELALVPEWCGGEGQKGVILNSPTIITGNKA